MPRKKFGRNRKNRCRFCTREGCPRPAYVDYKDIGLLKKLCTNQSKMFSRKRSGRICAAFQRASSAAVKHAAASCGLSCPAWRVTQGTTCSANSGLQPTNSEQVARQGSFPPASPPGAD